jgi:hypothetical protein
MLAGKKKSKPSPTPVPAPEGAPSGDQSYVNIAFDTSPQSIFLGDTAVAAKVSGVESDGFVYPLPDETLANWYTRVAYWGAYPHYTGAPYEIPPQCLMPELAKKLGAACDPRFFPYRDALLGIYALVVAEGKKRGVDLDRKAKSFFDL